MPPFRGTRSAFGGPGDDPRWTGAAKDGVGTAHFFGRGIVTEVYYPTIDRPFWPMAGRLSEKNSKSGQFFKLSALLASR